MKMSVVCRIKQNALVPQMYSRASYLSHNIQSIILTVLFYLKTSQRVYHGYAAKIDDSLDKIPCSQRPV